MMSDRKSKNYKNDKNKTGKSSILKIVKLLPDSQFLKICETFNQIEHWSDIKTYYTNLGVLLKHYFNGTYCTQLDNIHPKNREFWLNNRDVYLSLYNLIQEDWINIKSGFLECDYSFLEPYQLFCQILINESEFEFFRCTNDVEIELTRFSPKKLYQIYQNPEIFITSNNKNINKWQSRLAFQFACLAICEKSSLSDLRVKEKLKAYYVLQSKVTHFMFSNCHPSKNRSGYQWVNGSKQSIANKRS